MKPKFQRPLCAINARTVLKDPTCSGQQQSFRLRSMGGDVRRAAIWHRWLQAFFAYPKPRREIPVESLQ